MPYYIKKLPNGRYGKFNKLTGKLKSTHDSKEKAQASARIIMAKEHGYQG